ncbi:hypothetical protein [Sodalis glossinidius]|nr:hypothetical protein [Sodalis glossinidius]
MNIEWVRARVSYALADIRQVRNGQLGNLADDDADRDLALQP